VCETPIGISQVSFLSRPFIPEFILALSQSLYFTFLCRQMFNRLSDRLIFLLEDLVPMDDESARHDFTQQRRELKPCKPYPRFQRATSSEI
jgi:hypothetical protein